MLDLSSEMLTECLRAVGEKQRERILVLLGYGERTVDEITQQLAISQPTISYHLQILRRAGLVSVRRCGRQRVYRSNPNRTAECSRTIRARFGLDGVSEMPKSAHS